MTNDIDAEDGDEKEDTALIRLAKEAKDAFKVQKELTDGRPYRPSKRYEDNGTWLRVAKVLRKYNASAKDYMTAQFSDPFTSFNIFANTLHGPKAIQRYLTERRFALAAAHVVGQTEETTTCSIAALEIAAALKRQDIIRRQQFPHCDWLDFDAMEFVLTRPQIFDSLCMILLNWESVFYRELFLEDARKVINDSPSWKEAIRDKGLSNPYIEDILQ